MKHWQTNLGGAISITGSALLAVGILPQLGGSSLADSHGEALWWITVAGFILTAIGKGMTALFAADASKLAQLASRVDNIEKQ